MIALKGASLSIKLSIFSEKSKIIVILIIKIIAKKKVPKNFRMIYKSNFPNILYLSFLFIAFHLN